MTFDFESVALGRRSHDPSWTSSVRRRSFSAAVPSAGTSAGTTLSLTTWKPTLAMNNVLPTCTIAGLVNSARVWSLIRGGFDLKITGAALRAFFASLVPCDDTIAAIAATDGLQLKDVLTAAEAGRFNAGQQAPLVPEYGWVDVGDVRVAIDRFTSVYIGLTLYEADVAQGAVWNLPALAAGKPIGGHCVVGDAYNSSTVRFATWGGFMDATDEWLDTRFDEGYGLEWTMAETR